MLQYDVVSMESGCKNEQQEKGESTRLSNKNCPLPTVGDATRISGLCLIHLFFRWDETQTTAGWVFRRQVVVLLLANKVEPLTGVASDLLPLALMNQPF